jgi:N-methylhydantoinase A
VVVATVSLSAIVPMPHLKITASDREEKDPGRAMKGYRQIFWSPKPGYENTPIYERDLLVPGNTIPGPAIVEAKDTNCVVPIGTLLKVDSYSNTIMEEFNHE